MVGDRLRVFLCLEGLQEGEQLIRASNARRRQRVLLRLPQLLRQHWYTVPFWLSLALIGSMFTYWAV